MSGLKALESLKVWEDICRGLHPFGQPDGEIRDGAEDVGAVWLHKVKYRIMVIKDHFSQARSGSCCDCSHE